MVNAVYCGDLFAADLIPFVLRQRGVGYVPVESMTLDRLLRYMHKPYGTQPKYSVMQRWKVQKI